MDQNWIFKIASSNIRGAIDKTAAETPAAAPPSGGTPVAPPSEGAQAINSIATVLFDVAMRMSELEGFGKKIPLGGLDVMKQLAGAGWDVKKITDAIAQAEQMATKLEVLAGDPSVVQSAKEGATKLVGAYENLQKHFGWFGGLKADGPLAKAVSQPLKKLMEALKKPVEAIQDGLKG